MKSSNTSTSFGLQTPSTDNKNTLKSRRSIEPTTPYTPTKPARAPTNADGTQNSSTTLATSDEEFYDWPASDDEDVLKAADQAASMASMVPPETPSKVPRTDTLISPGKRRFSEMEREGVNSCPTSLDADGDVFVTPNTGLKRSGLSTPRHAPTSLANTPNPRRFKDILHSGQDSELTSEVLRVLQDSKIAINSDVKAELKTICDRHALSTRGIMKGRDISRAMVNTKNEKISELQEAIAALEAERESNRAVIRHLRRDMEIAKISEG
ncbi:MAG: hypothetical protein L6R39_006114 [Caloplaca ligustica]|nr:MAG: hypothetical protein L6R39_006114 [Caloplaca ligustica]